MNNIEFWLPIIISSIVSILGFGVTIFTTYKQFKNSKKERIVEKQSELYLECYNKIEPIINSPFLVFDNCYYENILFFKAEMKLIASNSTLRAYKAYLQFVYDALGKFNIFYSENDPHNNEKYIETVIDTATGDEHEIQHIPEQDRQHFNYLVDIYRSKHCPDVREIKNQIAKLLNSMRKDLLNTSIETDIIE